MSILDLKWMEDVIGNLSKRRPVFYSEADFQFELAWELRKEFEQKGVNYEIRLEYPATIDDEPGYIDIVVIMDDYLFPIELKYKTRKAQYQCPNEPLYDLKEQSAQDISRYLFWKDVHRIESLSSREGDYWGKGFVVFLTNDDRFWRLDGEDTMYKKFSMVDHDYEPEPEMKWNIDPVPENHWTTKQSYKSFKRNGAYTIHWERYGEKETLDKIKKEESDKTEMKYVVLQCNV